MPQPNDVALYHAHVYFAAETVEQARALCESARDRFSIAMGRMHERPVGPHPVGSCQMSVPVDLFALVIPWLNLNRGGLTVFVHPVTGDDLFDHRDAAIWLGDSMTLKLEMFT